MSISKTRFTKHIIKSITPDSIADEIKIEPGDILLSMNGNPVQDVLDFRFFSKEEMLILEIEKQNGEIWELEIEKDEDEDVGLVFETGLMDTPKTCRNKCIFCFMDQLPPGMRDTLYIKYDDPRLSFLTGNYVTLTNMTMDEIKRIAYYHLSPLHISVHTADLDLREQMIGTHSPLFHYLQLFNDAGIRMHFQIVLCKGINDGEHLDYTIGKLLTLQPGAASLSVVPAGLTRHRKDLYALEPFTKEEAEKTILQIDAWQQKCLREYKTAFIFCADEWYLLAQAALPVYEHYEDFPQLENGVGMMALFEREFNDVLPSPCRINKKVGIITGEAAAGFMRKLTACITPQVTIYKIQNDFFGSLITVSGLLTGKDIINQLQGRITEEVLFVPKNMFRGDSTVMLDGTTLQELIDKLRVSVIIGSPDGGVFAKQLLEDL